MVTILAYIPLVSSITLLVFAFLILSRKITGFHKILLFSCLILTACSEFCIFNAIKHIGFDVCIFWVRMAAIFLSIQAGTWYLFAVTFYVKDYMAAISRHGTLIAVFFTSGLFFLLSSFSTDFFYYGDDASKAIYTGNIGKAFVTFVIIVTVSILFIFENTFKEVRYSQTWREIKPIIFGIALEALSLIVFLVLSAFCLCASQYIWRGYICITLCFLQICCHRLGGFLPFYSRLNRGAGNIYW